MRLLAPPRPDQLRRLAAPLNPRTNTNRKQKEEPIMGGQAFEEGRINGMYAKALDKKIRIIGLDTKDGPEHVLYDISDRNRHGDVQFAAQLVIDGGIKEPIILRKDGEFYDVAIGRRRLQAARLIEREPEKVAAYLKGMGLPQPVRPILVPLIIDKGDDEKFAVMVAAENAQRKDLSLLQKAQQAMALLERVKNKARVAVTYGVDVQTITEWSKIQDLHPKIVEAIDKTITLSAATKLAPLAREEQLVKYEDLASKGGPITAAKTRAAAKGQESTGLSRGQIRKVAKSEDIAPELRNFALAILGEYPVSKIKGLTKVLDA